MPCSVWVWHVAWVGVGVAWVWHVRGMGVCCIGTCCVGMYSDLHGDLVHLLWELGLIFLFDYSEVSH